MTIQNTIPAELIVLLIVAVSWDLAWRLPALWRAARNDQRAWFTVLLVVNSVGILPIIYLLTNRRTNT